MRFSPKVVEKIRLRADGFCEFCGGEETEAMQAHHRRPRGMGGSKDEATGMPSNGLWMHYECHRTVEQNREHAIATGFIVQQHRDPKTIPVLTPGTMGVILDDDGNSRLAEPAELSYG
jgi:5-methylcytosine-specific restriction protein A